MMMEQFLTERFFSFPGEEFFGSFSFRIPDDDGIELSPE
jgi:hypothetical protein